MYKRAKVREGYVACCWAGRRNSRDSLREQNVFEEKGPAKDTGGNENSPIEIIGLQLLQCCAAAFAAISVDDCISCRLIKQVVVKSVVQDAQRQASQDSEGRNADEKDHHAIVTLVCICVLQKTSENIKKRGANVRARFDETHASADEW